jgi:hypothetical protein
VLNKSKYLLYFIFLKVATLCLDDSFHTLGILSTSFIWNAFPTVLKEIPPMLSTCWLLFRHSAVQLIVEKQMIVRLSTNQMGWRIAAECLEFK